LKEYETKDRFLYGVGLLLKSGQYMYNNNFLAAFASLRNASVIFKELKKEHSLAITTFMTLSSQYHGLDSLSKSEMAKLGFITGEWDGSGWMMTPSGEKIQLDYHVKIKYKLDSVVMLLEGMEISREQIIFSI
jgi:hypothetical protein